MTTKQGKANPSQAKPVSSNYRTYNHEYGNVPTVVEYQDVDSAQLAFEITSAEKQNRHVRKSNERRGENNNGVDKFSNIQIPNSVQNELCIKMDRDLDNDLKRASSQKYYKGRSTVPISIADDSDNTLNLSPIH